MRAERMGEVETEGRQVLQKAVGDQSERGRGDPEHSGSKGRPDSPERKLEALREITEDAPIHFSNRGTWGAPGGAIFP